MLSTWPDTAEIICSEISDKQQVDALKSMPIVRRRCSHMSHCEGHAVSMRSAPVLLHGAKAP